jgi:hypothetical protein
MKRTTVQSAASIVTTSVASLLLAYSSTATAQVRASPLPALIDQNVRAAVASSERIAENLKAPAPQLWIHVRSLEQKSLVEQKRGWFRSLQVGGTHVDLRPTQVVATGPQQTQLRFFRAEDRSLAQALLNELRKGIPGVVLSNLSGQYKQATWIDAGHLELWLAPGLKRIAGP